MHNSYFILIYDSKGNDYFAARDSTNLEELIREWDSITFNKKAGRDYYGEISVKSFDANGMCTRHGNIIHVTRKGRVYLNPTISV